MKSRTIPIAFSLFVVSGLVGWSLAPSPREVDSQMADLPAPTPSSRSMARSSRSGGPSHEDARMNEIRESKNEGERMRMAIEFAKSLPLEKAGKWLNGGLFRKREGYALALFTKILEQRWSREDPDGYLVWKFENGRDVSKEEIARLAESNPEKLLAKIRLIHDPDVLGQAIANLAKARPDLVLAELAKMNVAQLVHSGKLGEVFGELAKSDLAGLQSAVDGLPFTLQGEAEKAIFGHLLARDFAGTLPKLLDLPNGLEIFMGNYGDFRNFRQSLLESFSSLPKAWQNRLEEGGGYDFTGGMNDEEILSTDWESYGLSGTQMGEIKGDSLFSVIRENKEEALELFQNANLNEAGRRRFLEMLSWNDGAEIIEGLMPHLETADRDFITKKMENEPKFSDPTKDLKTAADFSEALAKVDHQVFTRYASSMQGWNAEQKAQFQTDYAAMQGEKRHRVTAMLAGAADLEMRASAVSEILGNEVAREVAGWDENRAASIASTFAVELFNQDVDRGATWVSGLPDGDARTWVAKNLAANWKRYDSAAAEKWVNSLPAGEQGAVRSFLENPQ